MVVSAVGYGAGTIDLPGTPNILRLFIGESMSEAGAESIVQLETTIDDMSPQLYEPLMERLFEAGAVDVFLTPVVMKRSRPGTVLTALCPRDRLEHVIRALFEESSTIGLRWTEWQRVTLPRETVTLPTTYGAIQFKVSRLEGRVVTVTPEFADVTRIARDKALPVREVLDQARAEMSTIAGRLAVQFGLELEPRLDLPLLRTHDARIRLTSLEDRDVEADRAERVLVGREWRFLVDVAAVDQQAAAERRVHRGGGRRRSGTSRRGKGSRALPSPPTGERFTGTAAGALPHRPVS